MRLSLGTHIGPYTVLEHVGSAGTSADVYRARDELLDRDVALKLLAGANDSRVVERGRREARAVARLDHPNIVTTYEVIEHNGRLCLVQEWIDGASLETELHTAGLLTVRQTVQIGLDVASALSYAHRQGILHRDIKPSNVLRTAVGSYKLVDFGAVGQLQHDTGTTMSGEIAGTPLYMSPEQITGAAQTPASDLFGLGLLLYRCLHGRLPGEESGTYVQLAFSRIGTSIRVPPSPLQGLLERCLATDPTQRPPSAEEVLTALAPLTSGQAPGQAPPAPVVRGLYRGSPEPPAAPGAGAPPGPAARPLWQQLPPPRPAPVTVRPDARGRARGRWVISVGLIGCLLAVAVGLLGAGDGPVRIGAGLAVAVLALAGARQIRRRLSSRAPEVERRAVGVLFGADQRAELTRSLIIEVDQVIRNLDSIDAKFLGMTVVAMIREYEQAKESAERQAALLHVVTLMEKLQNHLSPWHVRHKDAIAAAVAVVGALTGVAGVVSGLLGR